MKMVKNLFTLMLGCGIMLSLASCANEKEDLNKSYVTVEINPSVEIVLNGDDEVVTINGLNEDGKMLISEEDIVGEDIEKALDLVIEAAQSCGYLVSSTSENAVQRNISVSVSSSDAEHVAKLEADVKITVENIIDKDKINAAYEQLKAKERSYFESIAKQYDPSLTDEKLSEMSDEELMKYVELATIEKAELATIEMEKYYLSLKEYEFQLKYKEQIAEKLASLSSVTSVLYTTAINALRTAIEQINQIQYDLFVSEDSQYLALLAKLNEYKDKNVVLNYKYSKGQTEEDGTEITVVIETNKDEIEKVEAQITTFMNGFNNTLEKLKSSISTAITQLEELEKNISNVNYNELLTNVEVSINDAKDGVLAKFEEAHADDIEAAKQKVKERKENLEASIVR